MLLRHSLELETEAAAVESALAAAIAGGARTADIAAGGETAIATDEMTAEIIRCLS
jgi:3-isopropylmalate dehydrogenase